MTGSFALGLGVALVGALLLAAGSELQSRAVFQADGHWRVFLRAPRWWAGVLLLGTAVSSNFVALALAPVSVVQSVSIVALATSAVVAHWSGRAPVGGHGAAAIALCAAGIIGFITLMRGSLASGPSADPLADLAAVTVIVAAATALGMVAVAISTRNPRLGGRPDGASLLGLVAAALIFGSITTVFKVVVTLVLRDGLAATLALPAALLGLAAVAAGGVVANVLLQRSHHRFPAPVVVAAITIIDPLTAAVIGISVLGEVQLTVGLVLGLVGFGAIACAGVLGLTRIQRAASPAGASGTTIPSAAAGAEPRRAAPTTHH